MAKEKARMERAREKVEKASGVKATTITMDTDPWAKGLGKVSTSFAMIGTMPGGIMDGEIMKTNTITAKITGIVMVEKLVTWP